MLVQQISVKFGEKFIAYVVEDETMEASMTTQVMPIVDMMIGMGAGMVAEPFMMKRIKQWRTRRKVNKMLNEIVKSKKEDVDTEEQPQ